MKRSGIVLLLLVLGAVYFVGCASPKSRAQKLYDAEQYQEVVTRYGNDPTVADIVRKAQDKIAQGLYDAGRYQAVVDSFPQSPVAKDAANKLAEGLLLDRRYMEVLQKYPNSPSADKARAALDSMRTDSLKRMGAPTDRTGTDRTGTTGRVSAAVESRAEAELDRIMAIKLPDLRLKSLREFVANSEYAGTRAVQKARAELNRATGH